MKTEEILVFVYGTLKRGGQYHYLMQRCNGTYVSDGLLTTPYPLLLAEYPCLLDRPGAGLRVKGEIFSLPDKASWEILDQLEGHPSEYRRRPEKVETQDGILAAWTYFYIRQDLDEIQLKPVSEFRVNLPKS